MRSLYLFLLMTTVAFASACDSKEPSYSNININGSRQDGRAPAASASPEAGAEAVAPETLPPPPPSTATPVPAPSQPSAIRLPEFFDGQKGSIKDLPSYPDSMRINVQYGPLSGAEMAMIVSQSPGPMAKITEFYDRAIKSNGWTIVSETREAEKYRMNIKKGDKDAGTVEVTPDAGGKRLTIAISRTRAQ